MRLRTLKFIILKLFEKMHYARKGIKSHRGISLKYRMHSRDNLYNSCFGQAERPVVFGNDQLLNHRGYL